jgi:hypothetical protein
MRPILTSPAEPYRYHMLINGQWVEAASGRRCRRESPGHDVPVGDYPLADVVDIDAAVAKARRAFDEGPWLQMKVRNAPASCTVSRKSSGRPKMIWPILKC